MTIEALTQMKQLRDTLAAESLGITADLTAFPSGGAMLDERRDGRAFVMVHAPIKASASMNFTLTTVSLAEIGLFFMILSRRPVH